MEGEDVAKRRYDVEQKMERGIKFSLNNRGKENPIQRIKETEMQLTWKRQGQLGAVFN